MNYSRTEAGKNSVGACENNVGNRVTRVNKTTKILNPDTPGAEINLGNSVTSYLREPIILGRYSDYHFYDISENATVN